MKKHIVWLLFLSGCNCGGPGLSELAPVLVPSQNIIDFGQTYIGGSYTEVLEIENIGGALLSITSVETDDVRITTNTDDAVLAAGEVYPINVTFVPDLVGEISATLTLESDAENGRTRTFELRATVLEAVDCNDQNPCTVDVVNYEDGSCRHDALNGVPCEDGNRCSTETRCVEGECIGAPVVCADPEIACLQGACDAEEGCIVVANDDACNDDDPCTADTCDEERGCLNEVLPNGALCGPPSCEVALICTFGDCLEYDVPDETVCFDGDSCTTGDRCLGGECVGERVGGPIEELDRVNTFANDYNGVAVGSDGNLVFVNSHGPGRPRITRVLSEDGTLRASARKVIEEQFIYDLVPIIVDDEVFVIAPNDNGIKLRKFALESLEERDLDVELPWPDRGGFSWNESAQSDDHIFLCFGDVNVIRHSGEVMPTIALPPSQTCRDVTFADNILTIASEDLDEPYAVHLTTWSINENGIHENISTWSAPLDECEYFTDIASTSGKLILACDNGSISFEPGTLRVLEEQLQMTNVVALAFDESGQLFYQRWNVDNSFEICNASSCSPLNRAGSDQVQIGGPTLTSGTQVFSKDTLTSFSANEHGFLNELARNGAGLVAASLDSAYSLETNPLSIIEGGVSAVEVGSYSYGTLGFGPGGGAPLVLVDSFNMTHHDASSPANPNPVIAGSLPMYLDNQILVGNYLYQVRAFPYALFVVDPQTQEEIHQLILPGFSFPKMAADADGLLLEGRNYQTNRYEFLRFDLTNPVEPILSHSLSVDSSSEEISYWQEIALFGNKIALLRWDRLQFYSYNQQGMRLLGELELENGIEILHLENNFAYLATHEGLAFVRLDVSPPQIEQIIDINATDLEILGDKVYVATGTGVAELSPPCPGP